MANILTDRVFTLQSFLEIITGYAYTNNSIDDRVFIHNVVNYLMIPMWSFSLSQYNAIGNENVVLVECFNMESNENEFIWFSVPERFCDTFKNI